MASAPFSLAALAAEIRNDPAALGYAAGVAAGNHTAIAALLNAATRGTAYRPISAHDVLKWGAATGVRLRIQQAAAAAGPYAAGGARDITANPTAQSIALAVLDELAAALDLDLTDPAIVGVASSGDPYTPGATLAAPGMLDALAAAAILTDGSGASLKDSLMAVGAVAAGRATLLWGYAFATNPGGPAAAAVTTDQIADALRN